MSSDRNKQLEIFVDSQLTPEETAYGYGRLSRSSKDWREIRQEISEDKASAMLEKFAINYGHESLRDMAHVGAVIQNCSILAAIALEDEPLWDGQERSTRYQDFKESGYFAPERFPIKGLDEQALSFYRYAMDNAFINYENLTERLQEALLGMAESKEQERAIKARIFDLSRSLLPYGTNTSVAQVVSARTYQKQIRRLLASDQPELMIIGYDLAAALAEFQPHDLPGGKPPLSTLLKHIEPDPYAPKIRQIIKGILTAYAGKLEKYADTVENFGSTVSMFTMLPIFQPTQVIFMNLLYRYSDCPFLQIANFVQHEFSRVEVNEYLADIFQARGDHDQWPRECQVGQGLLFEFTMDGKSSQDFFRHRNVLRIAQDISFDLGYSPVEEWFGMGLNDLTMLAKATESGALDAYTQYMDLELSAANTLAANMHSATIAPYALPVGARRRFIMYMSYDQARYMIETRSATQGHFFYRNVACRMWELLNSENPELARHIRVTPFDEANFFNR